MSRPNKAHRHSRRRHIITILIITVSRKTRDKNTQHSRDLVGRGDGVSSPLFVEKGCIV